MKGQKNVDVTNDSEFCGPDAGDYMTHVLVAPGMLRTLIGPKGINICKIQEEVGVRIAIDNCSYQRPNFGHCLSPKYHD